MTIRITDHLSVRRQDGMAVVNTAFNTLRLTAAQARDAAEAFNVIATMLEAGGDAESGNEESKELEEAA